MKYLFVHQNFPGQFLHIVKHLLAAEQHDVVFICEQNANFISGVRRVVYQVPRRADRVIHPHAREFEMAMARAEAVQRAARQVKALGFEPDIIIGHHGWGELLSLREVWPEAPLLGYHEFYYNTTGHDVGFDPEFPVSEIAYAHIRAKNAVNHPGADQRRAMASRRRGISWRPIRNGRGARSPCCRKGSISRACKPATGRRSQHGRSAASPIKASEKLVTYVARDLEPYRGFHILMRALPALLKARPDVRVVMVGGRRHQLWRAPAQWHLARAAAGGSGQEDRSGPGAFPGAAGIHGLYLRLLQRSDAHVYLTYPFVASWSLREAMACGCAIVGSDTAPVQRIHGARQDGRAGALPRAARHCRPAILRVLEGGADIKKHARRGAAICRDPSAHGRRILRNSRG